MDYTKRFRVAHDSYRMIMFLVSVSSFSLLLQSLKPFLVQLFSYTIGKSYMFLLCNGLVVFIVKNSGLVDGSSPTANQSKEPAVDNPEFCRSELKVLESKAPILRENGVKIEHPDEEEEKKSVIVGEEDGVSEKQEGDEDERNEFLIIDEGEHDEEETEELNKKCEDFIRKMKKAFANI
ncbi:hypothetical protein L6164_001869 [Bauhinia variegata]|uniref:Uncharacterized protein n=1 Tax=Bauhinia variegata TaxID=167791 RepID=A0ACB9QB02_BAUVA|nr:hypothetical protein L6164_001869 [Bauhinia variegata]